MIKAQPMSQGQLKEVMIVLTVVFFLFICLDYFAVADVIWHSAALKRISYKSGEILRAVYFLIFSMMCFYNSKGSVQPRKSFVFQNATKIGLFIISFIGVLVLIMISSFPAMLNKILYPVVFFASNISIGALILNYVSNDIDVNMDKTILGAEKNRSDKPLAIILEAHDGVINIPNPFRSVLVIGGAGAGKSVSIAEPIIYRAIQKQFTGFVYDFKFPTLADVVYSCFKHFKNEDIKFFPVSFTELDKSYRFNPLDPRFLQSQTFVEQYSWTLYSNLDLEAIKKGGFFPESAAGLLKAVIWFMKKTYPEFCTLPHIVNIILNADTATLVNMICTDEETKGMVKAVKEAAEKKAYDQLAGVIGSLTMQLQKVNTQEICWVLTGDDFTIDLNNPNNPKFIVLGSHPSIRTALSPIIAFISKVILNTMNQENKQQSIALIDEAPTLFIPNLDEIPATGRSNKMAVVYMAQDFSQMDAMYGKDKRTALVTNLATQFYGNVSGMETAKYVSDIIGKEYQMVKSVNAGTSSSQSGDSQSSGASYSEQHREIMKPQDVFSLPTGTFVGKLVESEKDFFKAKMKRIIDFEPSFTLQNIPSFITDFHLTTEEEKQLAGFKTVLENKTDALNEEHLDIKNIHEKLKSGKLNQEEFILETGKIMRTEFLKRRKDKILSENFSKIQSEVNAIISGYQ